MRSANWDAWFGPCSCYDSSMMLNFDRSFTPRQRGDGTLTQSIRDEQRKFIKYNHLVSNLLALHNVVAMMRAIDRLQADGHEISDEVMAALSPYQTEPINRF